MAKRITHDDIDKFFEYNIDLTNRTIYIGSAERLGDDDDEWGSGVDFKMAEYAIKGLMLLEAAVPEGGKPITIILNNPGGSEYHGMAIYDAIKSCRNQVIIKVFGYAASMGSLILQAGDKRMMAPNSRFMIHYGTWGTYDHPKTVYKNVEEGKRWDLIFENIYLDKMLEKDEAMTEAGNPAYLENLLSDIVNKYNQISSLSKKRKVKYKFSAEPEKRKEDLREALQALLDFDSEFLPEETVALGFADAVIVNYE